MEEKLQLCPEELFFLGKLMCARYIDYDYVRMMPDIQKEFKMREKEILASLVRKDLIMEDFSGTMELDEELEKMLKPVFFGEFESEVSYSDMEGEKAPKRYKYHKHEGCITQIEMAEGKLILSGNGTKAAEELESGLLSEHYQEKDVVIPMSEITPSGVLRLLVLKNMVIGKKAAVRELVLMDKTWYVGISKDTAQGLTKEGMRKLWKQLIMGE